MEEERSIWGQLRVEFEVELSNLDNWAKVAQMGTVEEEEEGGSTKGEDIVMDTVVSASGYNNQPFL